MRSRDFRRVVRGCFSSIAGETAALSAAVVLSTAAMLSPTASIAQEAGIQPIQPDLEGIVVDRDWARLLGKALFWDQQVGSDGMACASCHFSAGADSRIKNQLNPGFNIVGVDPVSGEQISMEDHTFGNENGLLASGREARPNITMQPDDFPFQRHLDETDRDSDITFDMNDVMSSAGSFFSIFGRSRANPDDKCDISADIFHTIHGDPARAVEPRNTPTTINSVFNHRNFWDLRAKNIFNGKGVFGMTEVKNDPTARVLEYDEESGSVSPVIFQLDNASLASQAVGPIESNLEMVCDNKTSAHLGRELLASNVRPLWGQKIDDQDSVFGTNGPKGSVIHPSGKGLRNNQKYEELIKKAFHPKFWAGEGQFSFAEDGTLVEAGNGNSKNKKGNGNSNENNDSFTQMELNFSMFWGIAVMLYEMDLVSLDSKWDTAVAGCGADPGDSEIMYACVDQGYLTELEADGAMLFHAGGFGGQPRIPTPERPLGGGRCDACHLGPLFAGPIVQFVDAEGNVDNGIALAPVNAAAGGLNDNGTFGIGNRPAWEDKHVGGVDPWGEPLSYARQIKRWLQDGKLEEDKPLDFPIPEDLDATFCPTGGGMGMGMGMGAAGITGCVSGELPSGPDADGIKVTVDSKSKTPGMRNVGLTAPYFSYGGYATLRQVVEFYARGGNQRQHPGGGTTCGSGVLGDSPVPIDDTVDALTNCSIGVTVLDLSFVDDIADPGFHDPKPEGVKGQEYGIDAIVAFMLSLTDPKVQCDAAPFDHPSLVLTHGHEDNGNDILVELPAVGAAGYAHTLNAHMCLPNEGDLFAEGAQNRVDPNVGRH